jgi:diguanylate cyclase (GGDEF)-like protein/PAS domain S-box-containing protein
VTEHWHWLVFAVLSLLLAYQYVRAQRIQRNAKKHEELFQIVTENAADMIALVDMKGRRLYNSPAYKKTLGYSSAELGETSAFEQIHPDDRFKILEAAREARSTGIGQKLEYRIRHKRGSWLIFESSASAIKNEKGEVEKLVIVNRDVTERKRVEAQLENNSFHESLTGLPNRRLFLDRLQHLFLRAKRHAKYHYAVVFMDIDGFKALNQGLGSDVCDQVLIELGRRLSSSLRPDDTVARPKDKLPATDPLFPGLGGDEFTILLDGIANANDAMRIARRLQAIAAQPIETRDGSVRVSTDLGIAYSLAPHERVEDLLADADVALGRAKALDGPRCELFDEGLHRMAVSRLQLESELQAAIRQHQFRAYYQPLVELRTKQITGFEVLLRWQHPERGIIAPHEFIEAAEDRGLLIGIGQWLILEACRQLADWRQRYPAIGPLQIALNLSERQFVHPGLVDDLKRTIREAAIEPHWMQLEITEGAAMANAEFTVTMLSQFKAMGIGLILDDFGSGRSSLSSLRRFSVEALKIDRSLIQEILADRSACDIVELIITLAHKLRLRVIAKNIESTKQFDRLRELGCELGQGHCFSPALDAKAAEQLLLLGGRPEGRGAGAR